MLLTCQVCGAPAEEMGRAFGMTGLGRSGQDVVVWYQRIRCVTGHWYQTELYEEDREDVDG